MVDTILKKFTYEFYDVNDKGYLTVLDIIIEAHDEKEAWNKLYEMDNNDEIDYSKAKNTRKKYTDQYEDNITEWFLVDTTLVNPAHNTGMYVYINDCIKINVTAFIDSLSNSELDFVEKLIEEKKKS